MQDREKNALEQLTPANILDLNAQQVVEALGSISSPIMGETIQKIVYHKNFRPRILSEQYILLKWISENVSDPPVEMSSKIGASHKAMEAFLYAEVEGMIPKILAVISDCKRLGTSKNIRKDSVHVTFSALAVLWHMYLFLGMRDEFFELGAKSVSMFDSIEDREIGRGFYQTCTHVARCMAVAYLSGMYYKDRPLMNASVEGLMRAYRLGIANSWDHPIVLKEFMESTKVYHELAALRKAGATGSSSTSGESLLLCAVRPHVSAKVNRLMENYRSFHSDQVQVG